MNIEVKAVHFTLKDETREYLDKKIARIHNAENMIVDLIFTLIKEKEFTAEALVNFRWGVSIHQKEHDFELDPAIDKLMDKLIPNITREKEKVKDKRSATLDKHQSE